MIVLKSRYSLLGKSLLTVALRLKTFDISLMDVSDLARLKKEYPLDRYSIEELESEFTSLTGELVIDVLSLAGRDRSKEVVMALLHISILYANEVGAPKATRLQETARTPGPSDSSAGSTSSHRAPAAAGSVTQATTDGAPFPSGHDKENVNPSLSGQLAVEDRVKAMEQAIVSLRRANEVTQVTDALRQISILASRPKLTVPSTIVAAVETLVDIATRTGHKDLEFYCKALQTCRRFENHPDLCGLCMRLFGSSEDKKISTALADWSKQAKYALDGERAEKRSVLPQSVFKEVPDVGSGAIGFPGAVWGPPGWGPHMQGGFSPYPPHYPYYNPNRMGRGSRRGVGGGKVCYFCKTPGHFVAKCPKLADRERK